MLKNLHQRIFTLVLISTFRNKIENIRTYFFPADQTIREKEQNETRQIKRQNELVNKLLAIISHDVRSPLNSLKSVLSLLLNREISKKELRELAGSLNQEIDQLSHFLENVLKWAKNNIDEIKPRFERIPIYDLVYEVIELLKFQSERKQVYLHLRVPKKIIVFADAEMVRLVLRNLISNAIKFCTTHDRVHVTAKERQGWVTISVQDTGFGINEKGISELFNLDHVSTKGTRNEIGTGLGLALCKDFIEKMGGKISVESVEGKGSCFQFTIHSPASPTPEFREFIEGQD